MNGRHLMQQSLKRSVQVLASLVFGLCCLAADKPDNEQIRQGIEQLQGAWQATKLVKAGQMAPAEGLAKVTFTFKGDRVINSIDPNHPAIIKVDPSKTPATIDFIDKADNVDMGIYVIEGDTLKFCMSTSTSKKPRPTSFESTKENGAMLGVFARKK
jgi:uncharacterized protein (TIGR03067 family)